MSAADSRVSMIPGSTALILMPCLARSIAAFLTNMTMPPLVALYGALDSSAKNAFVDANTTIAPPLRWAMTRPAARVVRNTPVRLTSTIRRQERSSNWRIGFSSTMPAVCTSTSRPPNRLTAALTARSTSAATDTSPVTDSTPCPSACSPAAAAWTVSASMSNSARFAPSAANLAAQARPMPWAPPTMRTVLPVNLVMRHLPAARRRRGSLLGRPRDQRDARCRRARSGAWRSGW